MSDSGIRTELETRRGALWNRQTFDNYTRTSMDPRLGTAYIQTLADQYSTLVD